MKYLTPTLVFLTACWFIVSASGCSDSKPQNSPSGDDISLPGEAEEEHDHDHGDEEKEKDGLGYELNRESENVIGPWLFYVVEEENEAPWGVLAVTARDPQNPSEEDLKAQIVQPTKAGGKIENGRSRAALTNLQLEFTKDGAFLIFAGELKEGVVFGNILTGDGRCIPARMIRPKQQLTEEPQPNLVEGVYALTEIIKSGAKWDELVKFIEEHPESPLAVNALYSMGSQLGPREVTREKVEQLFELSSQTLTLWGNRLKQYARLNTLVAVVNIYRYPDLFEEIRQSLVGEFPEPMWEQQTQFVLKTLEAELKNVEKVEQLRSSTEDSREEILAALNQAKQDDRFNFNFLRATAEALEELDEKKQALEWYLDFMAIPGFESFYLNQFQMFAREMSPTSEKLESVWVQLHENKDGLSDALEASYQKLLDYYETPELKIPEENGKSVLVELFTGTACPPCVAADLAFSKLHQELPSDRVVFLQYHVHSPAPDPLTGEGTSGRYHYYGAKGTPTTLVNGRMLEGVAGPASLVTSSLLRLNDEIAEQLTIDSPLEISAEVKPGKSDLATFKASVKADELSERWRLNVVLAEEKVKFTGQNQVPIHTMVVRQVITPSQGESPQGDALSVEGTIDLKALTTTLNEGIAKVEKQYGAKLPEAPLDFKNLHLIVFVQDHRNQRVRQVISIPVTELSSSKGSSAAP
jgi:thiol-disulfide isomerase/thioredoxin